MKLRANGSWSELLRRAHETDAALVRACNANGRPTEFERFLFYRGAGGFDLPVSVKLDGNRLQLAARPKRFGGDTVGRLGMCAHTPKRNKNNAHGVTPIRFVMRGRRRPRFDCKAFLALRGGNWPAPLHRRAPGTCSPR